MSFYRPCWLTLSTRQRSGHNTPHNGIVNLGIGGHQLFVHRHSPRQVRQVIGGSRIGLPQFPQSLAQDDEVALARRTEQVVVAEVFEGLTVRKPQNGLRGLGKIPEPFAGIGRHTALAGQRALPIIKLKRRYSPPSTHCSR